MHHFFFRLAAACLAAGLAACAAERAVPIGQIPPVERPEPAQVKQTIYGVVHHAKHRGQLLLVKGLEYERVKAILDKLTDSLGAPRDTWPLVVLDGHDVINAAAYNRNTLVVYTGLIRRLQQDDQLAVIIAHEIAHVLAKHVSDKDRGDKTSLTSALGTIVGVAATVGAAAAGMQAGADSIGSLADGTVRMAGSGAILAYDRSQEYEADEIGLMILTKAGYDPQSAIQLWERAAEIFGASKKFSLLDTHPAGSDRVNNLKKVLPLALKYRQDAGH